MVSDVKALAGALHREYQSNLGDLESQTWDEIAAVLVRALSDSGYVVVPARVSPSDGLRAKVESYCDAWVTAVPVDILRAALATTGQPDEATVVAMENEGVVTWGDDGHRARFLRATVEGT
jgi:hypothetical protein